ncbi:MAG: methyl-accepting chemotaxis protein [Patescibacteria group bacterium]
MWIFFRIFASFTLRLTVLVVVGALLAAAVLTLGIAAPTADLVREAFANQATAAIHTVIRNMAPGDRAALARGEIPGPDGMRRLQAAARDNGYPAVVFWRGGAPLFAVGEKALNAAARERLRALSQKHAKAWRGRTVLVSRGPEATGVLFLATPGRADDPISVLIPQRVIARRNRGRLPAFILVPLIAPLIALFSGLIVLGAVNRHLQALSRVANEIANGRLATPVPEFKSEDSLGDLYKDIKRMQKSLRELVGGLTTAAEEMGGASLALESAAREANRSSNSVASTMTEMAGGVSDLADNIRTATELITGMAARIEHTSRAAETATGISQETLSATESGLEVVSSAMSEVNALTRQLADLAEVVASLRASSAEIDEVVQFIAGVAEQTNLLALNASIEAAHAGESGAAFSILAERIQTLSANAAEAGVKIGRHIRRILDGISRVDEVTGASRETFAQAMERVNNAGQLFAQIGMMVKEITLQIESTAQNAAMLHEHGEQASNRMQGVAAFSEELAAGVEEVAAVAGEQAATSEQVGKTANELVKLANGFRETAARFET